MPPSPPRLDDAQIRRYGRQILLDVVGGRGQRALLASRVVVSLGDDDCEDRRAALVAIAYLAGAGVGTLELGSGLGAAVRESDLGILLPRADLGHPLIEAIGRRVAARNPDVRVTADASAGDDAEGRPRVMLRLEEELDGLDGLLGQAQRPAAIQGTVVAEGAEPPIGPSSSSARALWRGGKAATRAIAALLEAAR